MGAVAAGRQACLQNVDFGGAWSSKVAAADSPMVGDVIVGLANTATGAC